MCNIHKLETAEENLLICKRKYKKLENELDQKSSIHKNMETQSKNNLKVINELELKLNSENLKS